LGKEKKEMPRNTHQSATEQQAPALPWKVAYNGTATAMLTPASAIKFASTILKQGQQASIQHFVDDDWRVAESEQAKAMQKVGGYNQGSVAAMTQFDEYLHYAMKQAPKKNGLTDSIVQELVNEFVNTCKQMGVNRHILFETLDIWFPPEQG